jgi:curli production assembly/transport component CsgG/holdfast attachment protein HfaB
MAMTSMIKISSRIAVAAVAMQLSACVGITSVGRDESQFPQPVGPKVTANTTPLESAFGCMTEQLQAVHPAPLKIGVGQIRDYTGKFSEQDGGSAITQGGSLMAITALGKLHPAIRTFERFDTQVSEWELGSLSKRYLGDEQAHQINNNGQVQQVPWKPYMGGTIIGTDYFIVGGITELNYSIYSGGVKLEVDQIGPSHRVFVANVAVDLRLVDTNTLEVIQTVSLQKQIVGYETDVGSFKFFGNTLVDFQAGQKNNEPTQLAVRTTIEQAVLQLLGPLAGVDPQQCIHYDPQQLGNKVSLAQSMRLATGIGRNAVARPEAVTVAAAPTNTPPAQPAPPPPSPPPVPPAAVVPPSPPAPAPVLCRAATKHHAVRHRRRQCTESAAAASTSPAPAAAADAPAKTAAPVTPPAPVTPAGPPIPDASQIQSFAMPPPDTAAPDGVGTGQAGPRGIGINASRRPRDPTQGSQ